VPEALRHNQQARRVEQEEEADEARRDGDDAQHRDYCPRRPAFDEVACGFGSGALACGGGAALRSGATACCGFAFFEKSGMWRSPLCFIVPSNAFGVRFCQVSSSEH
jgi:hypothetical protein